MALPELSAKSTHALIKEIRDSLKMVEPDPLSWKNNLPGLVRNLREHADELLSRCPHGNALDTTDRAVLAENVAITPVGDDPAMRILESSPLRRGNVTLDLPAGSQITIRLPKD